MSALLAMLLTLPAAEQGRPVAAVFPIEDSSGSFTALALEQLSNYFTVALAEARAFDVVPPADLKELLRERQADSYRACYDDACQIQLGRELAASKVITPRLLRLGSACAVTATVLDLATATSVAASTVKAECTADTVVAALEQVVRELARPPPPPPSPPPPPPPPARLRVESTPPGAAIQLDGVVVGQTPWEGAEAGPGAHQLRLSLPGHLPLEARAELSAGRTLHLAARLPAEADHRQAEEAQGERRLWASLLGGGAVLAAGTATALFLTAPTKEEILGGAHQAYLAGVVAARGDGYTPVEDELTQHNLQVLAGWTLGALAGAALTASLVVLLSGEDPPSAAVEQREDLAAPEATP